MGQSHFVACKRYLKAVSVYLSFFAKLLDKYTWSKKNRIILNMLGTASMVGREFSAPLPSENNGTSVAPKGIIRTQFLL